MKKIFTFILALVAGAGTLFAEGGSCGENVSWNLTNGVLTIKGTGDMYNYGEKSNPAPWYAQRASIESVNIKIGVTTIGDSAFYDCSNMTSVHIPKGVTTIGQCAFAKCVKLSSVTIPVSLTQIGTKAFYLTKELQTVFWNAKSCEDVSSSSYPNGPFYASGYTSIIFGNEVEYIPAYLCQWTDIKSVTFGKNLREIGKEAFVRCDDITAPLIFPDKIETIGDGAFRECHKVPSITFNENLKEIGYQSFKDCDSVKSIVIPNSVHTIDYMAFSYCEKLNSVTIGEAVTYIGTYAFQLSPLKSVVWNARNFKGVSETGEYTPFAGLKNIESFVFGENVKRIPGEICAGMSKITSITIPASVETIGKNAFQGTNITSVVWNAKECGDFTDSDDAPFYAIRNNITSFVFGDKVEYIPSYLCYGMTKVPKVTIPASVTSIGGHAFDNCTQFTDILLPNDVVSVGEYAFANCDLTSVTFGSKVNSIGKYSFMGSEKITSVYNQSETPQTITANVFSDMDLSTCDLYVPKNSIPAYSNANVWKTFKSIQPLSVIDSGESAGIKWNLSSSGHLSISGTGAMPDYSTYESSTLCTAPWYGNSKPNRTVKSAEISDGITRVGNYAFWQCQDMTDVYIPNSVTSIGEYAFYYNKALKAVTLSDNIESIGQQAFTQCTSLTSLTLPIHLKSIESTAFALCSGLTSVVIPDEVEAIRDEAFSYCTKLTELTIPASVTTIDERAFVGCSKLTAIWNNATTPQNIKSNVFGGGLDKSKCKLYVPKEAVAAYMNAPVWKEFDIQAAEGILASGVCGADGDNLKWKLTTDGLLTIFGTGEMEAFSQAPWYKWRKSIISVIIAEGATTISPVAFMSCEVLSHVEIPSTVTSLGDGAFTSCYALSEITIPNSVKSLGNYTFLQCSSITSITIPEGVTTIGGLTFSQCVSLTDVKLPSTIKSLDASAFSKCASLTTITLPASLTTIGVSAFAECYALESVTNEAVTPQTINPNVFDGLTLSEVCLYVPQSSVSAYEAADVWKEFNPIWPIGYVPTGLESIQPSAVSSQKVIRDGQLLIERDGKIYTVTGQIVK